MTYQVVVTPKPAFLHVQVTGENTPESVRGYLQEVFGACIAHHAAGLLIEEFLTGPPLNTLEVFRLASEGSSAAAALPALRRIAYVDTNPAHRFENMALAEDIGRSRGLDVRVCRTVADAQGWLEADAAADARRAAGL